MYIKVVDGDPFKLRHAYDEFKTQEICIEAVEEVPHMLRYVPDNIKSPGMCEKAIEKWFRRLYYVPDHFKTPGKCESLLKKAHGHWCMSLISIRPKKCVIRQLSNTHGYWSNFKKQKMKAVKKIHTGLAKKAGPKKQK